MIFGGSAETHAELQQTALRMELELERLGQGLGDLDPVELAELATVIGSPELHEIALRLQAGLGARRTSIRGVDRRGADRAVGTGRE